MRQVVYFLICGLLLGRGALADDGAISAASGKRIQATRANAVLLARSRPIFVRMQVRLDGKPVAPSALTVQEATKSDFDASLFEHLDLNKDGVLSLDELRKAPATLAPLDADDDETISKAELMAA